MNRLNLALERFWFLVIILVAAFCVYEFIVDGAQTGKWYLLFLIIPILMYLFRRFLRLKMEKHQEEAKSKKK